MIIKIDKKRYYELKELRTGTPVHVARRFLGAYYKDGLPYMNRAPITYIIMKNVFLEGKKADKWIKIFEISLNFLIAADKKDTEKFDLIFDIMTKELLHFESNLHIDYEKTRNLIQEKITIREKFMRLMDFYTNLYEGYYKCIVSAFAISKIILNNKKIPEDIIAYIHVDPSVKMEELKKDDKNECALPVPELCEGCNGNLRNGISHKHWKIEVSTVEIWDWNIRKNEEAWRKKYTLETLRDEIDTLHSTCEAMMLAIILHSLSKHKSISGFLSIAPGNYDFDYIRDAMQNAAFDFGLFLNDCEVNESDNTLAIVLCVPDNLDLEQVSQIIEGSKPPRFYKIPICVVENSVRDMVLNFLLIVAGPMQSYSNVNIIVSDEKRGQLGDFKISASELDDFLKQKRNNVEQKFSELLQYRVKVTKEGPSVPDYPWNPVRDEELLETWKKINSVNTN